MKAGEREWLVGTLILMLNINCKDMHKYHTSDIERKQDFDILAIHVLFDCF